ncbi:hypothetical protein KC865_01375 [Candidatus Kaiserbacteria bacterium]|nr:hypothetical protein [Candidatus Kaiserbacteria bacterium]USN92644.1 MAG: hypothetical protein H6782_02420 [Candidatus Nomurabacteria bacterium]
MITQTQNTNDYIEPVIGAAKSRPTHTPISSTDASPVNSFGHKFKHKFINEQMRFAKKRLSEREAPQTLMQVGDLYLMKGNYKRAITYFLMAIDLKPDHLPAYEKILFACISHKDIDQANLFFRKVLEVTNRRPDILHKYAIFKALIDEKNRDVEEAISVLNEAEQKDPADYEVINTHGFILLNLKKDIEGSVTYFERSRSINNRYIHAINNLGVAHLRSGNPGDAEGLFKSVIEIDPRYIHSYQNLAYLYVNGKKYAEALETLVKAKHSQLILDHVWEHKIGWLLMELRNFEEAIPWYQKKIQEEKNNDLLYNNLGVCYKSVGLNTQGDACFEKAASLFKKHISGKRNLNIKIDHLKSSYNIGRSAVDRDDLDKLKETADFILRIHPEDAFGFYLRGAYLGRMKQYDNAKTYFEKSLEIEPRIREVYPDYSFILSSLDKDYEASIKLLEGALELGFDMPYIENNLAHAYILGGHFKKAEDILKKYKDDELPPSLSATKGLLCFRTGKNNKGDAYYTKAIERFASTKNKNIASQIWHYEKARHYLDNKKYEEAKVEIESASHLPESYVSDDVADLKSIIEEKISA